jgi:hypothetical protein
VKRFLLGLLVLLMLPLPASGVEQIHIVPGSNVNLVARDGRIPITVQNPHDETVTVVVRGVSTSFRLEVLEAQELTIPARTSAVAELPVRAIANGPVQVRVWLEVEGKPIGDETLMDIQVNYDIELFLIVSLAVAMFGLIVVGVFRTVLKLARSRGE